MINNTPILKHGEGAELTITTWGYADRIEVEFPEELSEYNFDCVYESTNYKQEEVIRFWIPLKDMEDGAYSVTVRAYKEGELLEAYPTFEVTVECILNEIRTRLR